MSKKLFVGSLSWNTTKESLQAAFEPFGTVTDAIVVTDRETGRSRGFGFVTFSDEASASSALEHMNGAMLDGRAIRCDSAIEKPRAPREGGDRGDRGGYRRDRY